jgi:GNAT superfamily N-acetyltransferase
MMPKPLRAAAAEGILAAMSGRHLALSADLVSVDESLRLRPFAGDPDIDVATSWYADPATAELVDGPGSPPYDRPRVAAMFEALSAEGEVYLIERRTSSGWDAVGDVTLAPDTMPITIAPEQRRQGIARLVLLRLADRARVLDWTELRVREVHPGNEPSRRLFESLGFVACSTPPPAFVLPLAPVGGRARR